jgi:hypothetical protein
MIKYLLVLILLLSCGTNYAEDLVNKKEEDPRPHKDSGIDERLQDYVNSFTIVSGISVNIPIVIEKINDGDKVGLCYTWEGKKTYNEIVVDKPFYYRNRKDFSKMEDLVWHELGHCVLGISEHDDSRFPDDIQCPNSIMNSNVFNSFEMDNCYTKYKKHYEEDLFITKGGLQEIN